MRNATSNRKGRLQYKHVKQLPSCFGGVVVRASDLRSRVRLPAGALAIAGSLGQLSLPSLRGSLGKSSTGLLAGIKVGRVHLCRVSGNTV